MVAKCKSAQVSKSVRRIVLEEKQASLVTDLVARLRKDFCRTDSSKVVNQIIAIFFQKYADKEYESVAAKFFDKRGYLRKLVNDTSIEDIDASIKAYLGKGRMVKTRKQQT